MTLEMIITLYAGLLCLVAFFAAGWAVATAGYCLHALWHRKPVRPVFKAMLEEW